MIQAVGRTLIDLLKAEIPVDNKDAAIVLQSPVHVSVDVRLSLFLYAAIENPYLKNQEPTVASPTQRARSPLTMDLYYLLTAYGGDPADPNSAAFAHEILARAMRVFYDRGVIAGSRLRPELRQLAAEAALRVTLNPITIEDMTRLWGTFPNKDYQLSVAYLVTPVPIPSEQIQSEQAVLESRLGPEESAA